MNHLRHILISFLIFLTIPTSVFAADRFWEVQSIDTMKYSRDASRNPIIDKVIPIHVKAVADTGANYIAIDTPYDDEFIPVLKKWVNESRRYGLHIWFRGNFSGWEGWFDYPKFTDYKVHHSKTFRFITNNPDIFQNGDIFTPSPEAEAGVIGDPRQTRKFGEFNQFLLDSYNNCFKAFGEIKKTVSCSYYSLNPDVIRETVSKETIQKMGGIVAIDHYAKTAEIMDRDVKALNQKFQAKVFLGEFGAPIPDIHGALTQKQQSDYIDGVLNKMYLDKDIVAGVNYWVIAGGSTTLLNDDNSPRLAIQTLKKYFSPTVITGKITNTLDEPLENIYVYISNQKQVTNKNGEFKFLFPEEDSFEILIQSQDYQPLNQAFNRPENNQLQANFQLEPTNPTLLYSLRKFLKDIL